MTRALSAPDADRAAAFAADARGDGLAVSLVGECATEFEGRAERSLPAGVRSVLWKPDDTVLVHGATGRDPDAWATGGSVAVEATDGRLELRCGDGDAADALTVRFDSVQHAAAFDPADADAEVSGTESDLKERVLADPDLVEPGFQPRSTERETPAGPVDVYGRGRDGAVVAVELKARRVGPAAASQLERYVNALRRDLHADADVRGVLVAPEITEKARRLLAENGLSFSPVE
ncbi:endonuclease NucS [Halobacterium hubeiense]|uniref:Endonuclease NucS n=2 Tax=Halobacterium TaxID=2239 RepID=A0A0U5CVQ7_9EURY|nr:endonuclease NucS [Halobacterium hubeiense]CQH47744.1 endonuclease NucS [Halobacterium hubeiense]